MKKFIIFLVLMLVIGVVNSGNADLLIEQAKVELVAEPGQTIVNKLTLHNTSKDLDARFTLKWEDFYYVPPFDGRKEFASGGTLPQSVASWVKFSPQEINLAPGKSQEINYSFYVPEDAKGGYNGVLFFEPIITSKPKIGINVVTRTGSLFFIEIKGRVSRESKIDEITLTEDDHLTGKIENKGNVILFPEGTYYILDDEGLISDRGELPKLYLQMEGKADFSIPLKTLPQGNYTCVLTYNLGEGGSSTVEVDLSVDKDGHPQLGEVRN